MKRLSTILLWKNFPWFPWHDTLHIFFFILWIFFLSSLGQLILLHLNDLMKFSQTVSKVPSFLMTTLQDNSISILSFRCCLNADDLGLSVLHSELLLQTSQLWLSHTHTHTHHCHVILTLQTASLRTDCVNHDNEKYQHLSLNHVILIFL